MRLCCTQDKNIDHLCSLKATILFVMLVVIETSDYITVEAFSTVQLARDFTVHRCFRACLYEVSQPGYLSCPSFTGLAWLMPGCLIKFALFLMRRRAGPLAKIPVARAEISANCGPTRGLAPEDRSRNFMEDVHKQATTKISLSFWTLMRLLGDPITITDILLTLDFVNSARSFDMTNGTICFRKENLFKGNW